MDKPQKKWSAKEIDLCTELRARGMTVKQIAQFMERSYYSVDGYLRRETSERARQYRQYQRDNYRVTLSHPVTKTIVPAHVLADRDRRANELRAGGGMQGEPPFSQSALARLEGEDIRGRAENALLGGSIKAQ